MNLNVGEEEASQGYLNTHGIFDGIIKSVTIHESSESGGKPVMDLFVQTEGGDHTEKFWLTEKAAPRLKMLYLSCVKEQLQGDINTDVFQNLVGLEVSFKLIPKIADSTGKVYYNFPYGDFIRLREHKHTLSFKQSELDVIEEVKRINSNTPEEMPKSSASGDLPF